MNRKLKRSRAIEYAILCYAAVLMLLVGPAGILDGVRTVAGNQATAGTTERQAPGPSSWKAPVSTTCAGSRWNAAPRKRARWKWP